MQNILFVCTGNICRSPIAEGLMAAALPDARVTSAGTAALVGRPADPLARELLLRRDVRIDAHRARQLDSEMCTQADLILVMEDVHRLEVRQRFPFASGKLFRFLGPRGDVLDPYHLGIDAFTCAMAQIEGGVKQWVERICQLSKR
ncbi:low molecular weight protein-tyrosine-phosphatase [Variovorax sp. PAMC 28711]|uniref:low molecular weight protein-tyrosine-phosphatase n=1 Tax=Variovorax sp. PAMC 28711 TaxID=1795631 RepID=UPI00078D6135|nr:low molecular weight protein-tyrosine-phosphatase [Variovorax sp. PAMC 28711]AMM25515.1 protein tyrosine phosphatase [Variovorax sp. PAMC 28711]